MGIKSTRTLKRSKALEMYQELHARLYGARGDGFSNHELGNILEDMQDVLAELDGTTNFDNYRVVDDVEYDELVQDWERY